ncbi:acetyltransferase [Marinigracilibium pacificum]|uniref:Acetyltransferase n=1 Tax=Marinigracilibium pacificum TaxID=2729599 RepID=A0A848J169_9BACT|nr:acetyltransferase [Marinigracilibium pacificum]NMM49098.1 acetyltransferase [Marinigracilibium pacificum]
MDKPVIIFGAGSLGKAALEVLNKNNIIVYCFLDDREELHGTEINDISVLGATDDDGYLKYIGKKCEAFIAEEENTIRKGLVKLLKERRKVMPINLIHPETSISEHAEMGHGNFLNAKVTLGTSVSIGNHCIFNTNSTIDHLVKIGDFVQIGAGSVLGTGVEVANDVFIGTGAVIVPGVKIGKGARIGAGSVVVGNVEKGQTVFGNPAKPV